MFLNFADLASLLCTHGSLTRRKILRHETSGFRSSPKEVVLLVFIVLRFGRVSTRDHWIQW
jgi:hypothetical protein